MAEAGTPPVEIINLAEKFGRVHEQWRPKIVAELNDAYVKLAKVQGEFVWHRHNDEDELFLVVRGSLLIRLRDRDFCLEAGELVVIPAGVDHLPVADEEAHVLLFEPKSTLHTGTVRTDRTVDALERV